MSQENTLIRGFSNGLVRCPKHGELYLWTAVTDSGAYPALEVVKYDCNCIVSWTAGMVGADATFEHVGNPSP